MAAVKDVRIDAAIEIIWSDLECITPMEDELRNALKAFLKAWV